ncbi:MAG: alpha/beta hydrolase [Gammaproteobacteria bacterium]|nr:alpha/beta hydrolase [Gammaproteobacteria bacterium]
MKSKHSLRAVAQATQVPTIVLVPGLDGTALLFYRQIPLLAERFNVVAFPLRDDPAHTMADLVDELRELIEQTASSEVILCGESFGGALAMSLALQHPEIVSGLVIVNSFPVIRTRLRLKAAPLALRMFPWAAMPAVRRFTANRLHSPHTNPEDLHEFHERSKAIGRMGYIRRLELLNQYDIRGRLTDLEPPSLFLAGDRDQLLPSVFEARYMAERVPRAQMQVLEGYGHICLINHDLNLLDYIEPWYTCLSTAPT